MAMISARAESALYGLLSANFNDLMATAAVDYDIQPFTIDFASAPRSATFFLGQINPTELEDTTVHKFPCMALYTTQSANQHRSKPADFHGIVQLGLDVVLSWRGGNAYQDFNATGHAVEDVMNTIANQLGNLNWVVNMGMVRGPVSAVAGQNWLQVLRFTFQFEIYNT